MLETPTQPQFPMCNISVSPQGMTIRIVLAPGTSITQEIPEEAMNSIVAKWLETRQEIKKQLAVIQNISRSRND